MAQSTAAEKALSTNEVSMSKDTAGKVSCCAVQFCKSRAGEASVPAFPSPLLQVALSVTTRTDIVSAACLASRPHRVFPV